MQGTDLGDGELVRRALSGDRSCFGMLVSRYERVVFSLCRQKIADVAAAEDVCQEVFVKAFLGIAGLRDPDRFGTWLYGIALRAAVDHHRRRGRAERHISFCPLGEPHGLECASTLEVGVEVEVERRECAERVLDTLSALPDRYRLVLTLRFQEGMSYREIAEHLGEPPGTVANRIHRAVAMLRERLGDLIS